MKTEFQRQRDFFLSGKTESLKFRLKQLDKLRSRIIDSEAEILASLREGPRKK